ncbi:chemotaxis protein CheA [Georgenia sp.]
MDDMDEIVREFLVESYENLDQLDQDLVALESNPGARELLSSIFRTIHTIKGTSGFLAFTDLERVSHAGENLLQELRDGKREMDGPTTSVLLAMVDAVRAVLVGIEAGDGRQVDVDVVIDRIARLQAGEPTEEDVAAPAATSATTEATATAEPDDVEESAESAKAAPSAETPAAPAAAQEPAAPAAAQEPATPAAAQEPAAAPAAAAPAVSEAPTTSGTPADAPGETSHRTAADTSIRVDTDLLDTLMRQVGELVLVRNQIDRLANDTGSVNLTRSAQRLSLIAGELQEGVMKTRMQPIEHIWAKMPRVVRDLAKGLGREVGLSMVGGDTELDRSLLEAVKDPLTHLVRNAVDHGIEDPPVRVAAGKPARGTVTLRAYHASGQVIVEISDDGAGIDPVKIGQAAVRKGLRTTDEIAAMAPAEILELLFLSGFSTATKVTNVSGRGVGMDVVRTKVEAIGGSVDVESEVGHGTTWRMRIPLTLAIMPALTVECAGGVYAIPQVSLLELVAIQASAAPIEYVGTAPVYRLRGSLLPLISLADVLGLEREEPDSAVIAVLQADDQRFGLIVDRVLNNEEIVIKALSSRLKQIGTYSGATVLGDGAVALILDIQAIARRALVGESATVARRQAAAEEIETREVDQLLVVAAGPDRHVAIPIGTVTRLERMPAARVERVGHREVIQYRGELLPLVRLDQLLGTASMAGDEIQVVVYSRNGRSVAMVVSDIVDIVDDDGSLRSDIDDTGLLGSTVVKERVTELLDVQQAVRAADPTFFDGLDIEAFSSEMAGM